ERLGARTHAEAGGLPPPASRALGAIRFARYSRLSSGPSSRTARAEGAIGGALLGAYWTFAVSEASAFKVKVQVGVLFAPLLHTPDQSTDRPLVTLRVILVPGAKGAERVVQTATLRPDGVEETVSPARPVAIRAACVPK